MFYVVFGILFAALSLPPLLYGLPPEHHGWRLQDIVVSMMPVVFLVKRTKVETVPILLMSAALLITVNRWLFGDGRIVPAVGFTFALLTALSGFRLRHRIGPMPEPDTGPWLWLGVAVILVVGILWLFSL
jgi:hypothetical protein